MSNLGNIKARREGELGAANQVAHELSREAVERVCKILPRLAAASDVEALQAVRAATKSLKGATLDWCDIAGMLFEHGVPRAPVAKAAKRWAQRKYGEKFAHVRAMLARNDLSADERVLLIEVSDALCLAPGNQVSREAEEFLDRLLRKGQGKGGAS